MAANYKLSLAIVAAMVSIAAADCPTNVRQLPLTGLLTKAVRADIAPEPDQRHALEVELGAAGGMRAETDDISGTAALSGLIMAHRMGLTGCASADLIDVHDIAARATASGQVPLGFTGLALGLSLDRNVRQPLAARAEFFRTPLSRIAAQVSLAFFDFDLNKSDRRLRVLVLPTTAEYALVTQDETLDRRTTRREGALVEIVRTKAAGSAEVRVLGVDAETSESRSQPTANPEIGFMRISPLSYGRRRRAGWGYELDGGVLSLLGQNDCEALRCTRGFYGGALRHAWSRLSVEARAERTAFLDPLAVPMIEDRVSATGSLETQKQRASTSVFAAHSAPFAGPSATRTAGTRLALSQRITGDFSAQLDGELVRALDLQARLLVSLAWHKRKTR